MAYPFQQNMYNNGAPPVYGGNFPFAPQGTGNQYPPPNSSLAVAARNATSDHGFPSQWRQNGCPSQSMSNRFSPQHMGHAGPPQHTSHTGLPQHMGYGDAPQAAANAYQPQRPATSQPSAKRKRVSPEQETPDTDDSVPDYFVIQHAVVTPSVLLDTLTKPIQDNRTDIVENVIPTLNKRLRTEEFRQAFINNNHPPGTSVYAQAATQVSLCKELIAVVEVRLEDLDKQRGDVLDYEVVQGSRPTRKDEWLKYAEQCDKRFREMHGTFWQSQEKYIADVARLQAKSDPEWMSRHFT